MFYAVYNSSTGALVSTGTVVADPLPAGLAVKSYAERPDPVTREWDAATRDYVVKAVVPPSLRRIDFIRRFTVAEREALKNLLLNGTTAQKNKVGAFWDYLQMDDDVYLGDSYIVASVQLMETNGVIAAGRAAQVLAYE